jgi:hypothetical protein
VFITEVTITNLFAGGEGESGGHVLRETEVLQVAHAPDVAAIRVVLNMDRPGAPVMDYRC